MNVRSIRLHIVRSLKMCIRMLFYGENMLKRLLNYFTKTEKILWLSSVALIICSFMIFDRSSRLSLCASLIGVTSLIFNAKGNPFGLVLMIIFSIIYGYISFSFAYYGEMVTYLGMTLPMSVFALVSWLRNPFRGNKAEVEINRIGKKEIIFMFALTTAVTAAFYFILGALDTANLIPSTFSVTTSFLAVYLTFRRDPYFAAAYAANDAVLIILWVLATVQNISYISVTVCFVAFLANDIYSFINWVRMEKRQKETH